MGCTHFTLLNSGRTGPTFTRFLANVNSRSRSLYAIAVPSVCLSVCNVGAPYSAGWNFRQFFFSKDSSFLMPKFVGGGRPFSHEICVRPISAHSASIVIASEKSSISTYRKSTTRFPTSHRWTVYVTPKSPKGWHKNAISLFKPVKFNFSRKSLLQSFFVWKRSAAKL